MRLMERLYIIVVIASLIPIQALAQASPTDSGSESTRLEDQVEKLKQAIAAQQQAMAEQQKQISEQRREIETLRQHMIVEPQATSVTSGNGSPVLVNTSLTEARPSARTNTALEQGVEKPKESPLSFHIGGAEFTPGGFVDLTAFWRSTNPGTGYGTNFFLFPFTILFPAS